jgi:hypothetical protein
MPVNNPTIRVVDFYPQNIHQPDQQDSGGLGTHEVKISVRSSQSIAGEEVVWTANIPSVGEVVLLSTII